MRSAFALPTPPPPSESRGSFGLNAYPYFEMVEVRGVEPLSEMEST